MTIRSVVPLAALVAGWSALLAVGACTRPGDRPARVPAGRLGAAPLALPLPVGPGQRWSAVRRHQKAGLPFALLETRHVSGLTLVVVPMNSPGVIGYGTLVRVGARDEVEPGQIGFARLIRRLMARGTRRFPAARRRAALRALGANVNSYTNKDRTLYYVVGRAGSLEQIVRLEADRIASLEYALPVFETETRAALGEYRHWQANPWFAAWEQAHRTAFRRHPYGHVAISRPSDVQAASKRYVASRQFYRRFYTPDNTTIIIAGDVKLARARALVDKHYGAWRGHAQASRIVPEPPQTTARRAHVDWATRTVPRLLIAYRIPAFLTTGNDSAAVQVINALSFGEASPLHRELVLRRQLASKLYVENSPSRDPHLFLVFAELTRPEHAAEVERAVTAELASLAAGKIDPRRVTAVRRHIKYSLLMVLNKPRPVIFAVARLVATRGSAGDFVTAYGQFDTVSVTDLARVAKRYLIPSRATFVTVHHKVGSPGTSPPSRPPAKRRPR
ncbi:MAG: pitrilysin family protein [bacterium]